MLSILTGSASITNIIGHLALVPVLGLTGAAIALTASELVLVQACYGAISRTIGLGPLYQGLMPFVMPAIVLLFPLSILPNSLFLRVIVGFLLISAALLIVWTLPTARHMREELALLGRSDVVSKD